MSEERKYIGGGAGIGALVGAGGLAGVTAGTKALALKKLESDPGLAKRFAERMFVKNPDKYSSEMITQKPVTIFGKWGPKEDRLIQRPLDADEITALMRRKKLSKKALLAAGVLGAGAGAYMGYKKLMKKQAGINPNILSSMQVELLELTKLANQMGTENMAAASDGQPMPHTAAETHASNTANANESVALPTDPVKTEKPFSLLNNNPKGRVTAFKGMFGRKARKPALQKTAAPPTPPRKAFPLGGREVDTGALTQSSGGRGISARWRGPGSANYNPGNPRTRQTGGWDFSNKSASDWFKNLTNEQRVLLRDSPDDFWKRNATKTRSGTPVSRAMGGSFTPAPSPGRVGPGIGPGGIGPQGSFGGRGVTDEGLTLREHFARQAQQRQRMRNPLAGAALGRKQTPPGFRGAGAPKPPPSLAARARARQAQQIGMAGARDPRLMRGMLAGAGAAGSGMSFVGRQAAERQAMLRRRARNPETPQLVPGRGQAAPGMGHPADVASAGLGLSGDQMPSNALRGLEAAGPRKTQEDFDAEIKARRAASLRKRDEENRSRAETPSLYPSAAQKAPGMGHPADVMAEGLGLGPTAAAPDRKLPSEALKQDPYSQLLKRREDVRGMRSAPTPAPKPAISSTPPPAAKPPPVVNPNAPKVKPTAKPPNVGRSANMTKLPVPKVPKPTPMQGPTIKPV
jgi:hypothetical protein